VTVNTFSRARSIRTHALCRLIGAVAIHANAVHGRFAWASRRFHGHLESSISTTPPAHLRSRSRSQTLTYLAAHEHINDLLREAAQARRTGELTSSRWPRPRGARTGTSPTVSADAVTLRLSRPAADSALEELAQLDCARPLHGPHLVAEVSGTLRAAISLTDGVVIADPFHPTTAMVELLLARANTQLSDQRAVERTPTSLLRRLVDLRKRSWLTVS
jgi:hypothetical protein